MKKRSKKTLKERLADLPPLSHGALAGPASPAEVDPLVELGALLDSANIVLYLAYAMKLTCGTCGAVQHCPVEQAISYQRMRFWPSHCDEQMTPSIENGDYRGRESGSWKWVPHEHKRTP